MTTKYFLATLLLVPFALCDPPNAHSTTLYPQLSCYQCDDYVHGCRKEELKTEVCLLGTTACMAEIFFAPNGTRKFHFRAGCATRHSCPPGHTKLMCTDFINNVKTCRLCCFENQCHDPTPGSEMRVKVMKDSLIQYGFKSDELDEHLARENEIAFNQGRKAIKKTVSLSPEDTGESIMNHDETIDELEELTEVTENKKEPASLANDEQKLTEQESEIFESVPYSFDTVGDKSHENVLSVSGRLKTEPLTLTTQTPDERSENSILRDEILKYPISNGKEFTSDSSAERYVTMGKEKMSIESKGKHMNDQALDDEQSENVPAAGHLKNSSFASKGVDIALIVLFVLFLPWMFL